MGPQAEISPKQKLCLYSKKVSLVFFGFVFLFVLIGLHYCKPLQKEPHPVIVCEQSEVATTTSHYPQGAYIVES